VDLPHRVSVEELRAGVPINNKKVGVFLSIPPRFDRWIGNVNYGPAIRQEVIDRWRQCGFEVYSVNSAEEAALLKPLVRNVDIVGVEDVGRVRISTIASIARSKQLDVTIISNADCIPLDAAILQALAALVGENDVCIGERLNFNQTSLIPTGFLCTGFDSFLMGAVALKNLPAVTEWRIGDPIWDYWFPYFQKKTGAALFTAGVPLVMHLDHEQAWNFETWRPKFYAFFREMPIGSPVFPDWFNAKFKNCNVEKAMFVKRLNVSMALYKSLAALPKVLPNPVAGSFFELQMRALNASAGQNRLSRMAILINGFVRGKLGGRV
jgi:hypothetical protein